MCIRVRVWMGSPAAPSWAKSSLPPNPKPSSQLWGGGEVPPLTLGAEAGDSVQCAAPSLHNPHITTPTVAPRP